jgi:fibronectin type 3 domain-containing protein
MSHRRHEHGNGGRGRSLPVFYRIRRRRRSDVTAPAAPTGLVATAISGTEIDLDWNDNAEPDVAGYKVYRSLTSGSGFSEIADVPTSAYSDSGLTDETEYFYRVTAYDNSSNESLPSAEDSATTFDVTAPTAPTGLVATSTLGSQIDLDWDDNAEPDLNYYRIYRGDAPGGPYVLIDDSVASGYADGGLTEGQTYYYVVTALDTSLNQSANSNEASVEVAYGGTDAPTGLAAVGDADSILLDWDDHPAPNLKGYAIYRSTSPGTGYVEIATITGVPPLASTYDDTSAVEGVTYYYVVTAWTAPTRTNESGFSNEDSANVTNIAPAAPAGLVPVLVAGPQINLDWNDNAEPDFAGYKVYRSGKAASGFVEIADVGTSAYSDAAVIGGTRYYYRVTAYDAVSNESSPSTTVNLRIDARKTAKTSAGNKLTVTSAPALNMAAGSFSIEAWFRPWELPQTTNGVLSKGKGTDPKFGIEVTNDYKLRGKLKGSGGEVSHEIAGAVSTLAEWYHVVWTIDRGADATTIYVNGAAGDVGPSLAAIGDIDNAESFDIGLLDNALVGDIGPVRLWKGDVLTSGQATYLYNGGEPLNYVNLDIPGSVPQPSSAWDMTEDGGNRADQVGALTAVESGTVDAFEFLDDPPETYTALKANVDRRPVLFYDNADGKVYAGELRENNETAVAISAASPFFGVTIRSMKWIEEKGWLLMAFGDYAGGAGGGVHIIELNVPTIREHTGVSGFDCTGIDYDRRDGRIYFVDNTNNQLKSIPAPSSTTVAVEENLGAASWSGLGIIDNNDAFGDRDLILFEGNNLVAMEGGNIANKTTLNSTTSAGGTGVHVLTNTDKYAPMDNNLIAALAGTKQTVYYHKMSKATGQDSGAVLNPGGATNISQVMLTAKGPWVRGWVKQTALYQDILIDYERSSQTPAYVDNTRSATGHGAEVMTTPTSDRFTHYACIERLHPVFVSSEEFGWYPQPSAAKQYRLPYPKGCSRGQSVAYDYDNRNLYWCGGLTVGAVYLRKLYRLDLDDGTWVELADAPASNFGAFLGNMGYYNGFLYYFGGADASNRYSQIHRYEIATNIWTTIAATLPTVLREHALIEDGAIMYIFGGTTAGFAERTARIHKFNAATEAVSVDIGTLPGLSNLSANGVLRGGTARLRGGTANYTQEQRVENVATTCTPTGVATTSGASVNSTYGQSERNVHASATYPYYYSAAYSAATANLKGPFEKLFPKVGAVALNNNIQLAGAYPRRGHYQGGGLLAENVFFIGPGLSSGSSGLQQMSVEVALIEGDWPEYGSRPPSVADDAAVYLHANLLRYNKGMQTTLRKLSNWIELIGRNDFIQDTDSQRPNYDGDGADASFKTATVNANAVTDGKMTSRSGQSLNWATGATFHIRARSLNTGTDKIQLETRNAALTAGISIGQFSRSVRIKVPGVGTLTTAGNILALSGIEDVAVRINAGATAADVFVNGVFAETLDITGNGGGAHSETWSVFSGYDGVVYGSDMVSVCTWDRALTDQEIADFRAEQRIMGCDATYEV